MIGYAVCGLVGALGIFLMLHGTGYRVPRRRRRH